MYSSDRNKLAEAHAIMKACEGKKGLYASPYRYRDQCWTRDFTYAGQHYLLHHDGRDLARRHLKNLMARRLPDDRIPIMFLDRELRWLTGKAWNSFRNRRVSFLLKSYFSRDGVAALSPWTRDSELMLLVGVGDFCEMTGDDSLLSDHQPTIERSLEYIRRNLSDANGLIRGADWRDTRPDLDDARLLTNNCWLKRAYGHFGLRDDEARQCEMINELFWNGRHYRDFIGSATARTDPDAFDTLGNALAILLDIADAEQAARIIRSAEPLNTRFGYKLNDVTLPPKDATEADLMSRISQVGVIWPFIHGFMALAQLKSGRRDLAERSMAQWCRLPGFYEYYDPETGSGHGSPDQMWSAAMFIRVDAALTEP